jgi:hypothetical protein
LKELKIGKYDFYVFLWAGKPRRITIFIYLKSNIRVETWLSIHAAAYYFVLCALLKIQKDNSKFIWKVALKN